MKVVYYGPALSGKTTSVKELFKKYDLEDNLESIDNTLGRTLYADFGAIFFKLGSGSRIKIQIIATSGQKYYEHLRPVVSQNADGIIFVVDSQKKAFDNSMKSWIELVDLFQNVTLPIVFSFNKQDLTDLFEPELFIKRSFEENFLYKFKSFEIERTTAIDGTGIYESFIRMIKAILNQYTINTLEKKSYMSDLGSFLSPQNYNISDKMKKSLI